MKDETELTTEPSLPAADTAEQTEQQTTDTQPETVGQPVPSPSADELAAMLAEAEQRGYLRGRNEQIALAMKAPALWQEPDSTTDHPDDFQPAILTNLRPSIWD